MASGKTNYLTNAWLNNLFRGTAYTIPTTVYIGLYTAEPTDSAAGTEATGGGYARQSLACNTTNFATAASGGSISTSVAVSFGTATANIGTITGFGIFDAATAGNLLYWGDISPNVAVNNGMTYSFASGAITVSEA